jgi:hypothetical protein
MPGSLLSKLQKTINRFKKVTWLEKLETELEKPTDKQQSNLNIATIRGILYYNHEIPQRLITQHAELFKEVLLRCAAEPLVHANISLYIDSELYQPHSYYRYKPFRQFMDISIGIGEIHAYLFWWTGNGRYALQYTFCDVLGSVDHGICPLKTEYKCYQQTEQMQVLNDPKTKTALTDYLQYQRLSNSTIISNAKELLARHFPGATIIPPIPDLSHTKMYANIRSYALEFRAPASVDNAEVKTPTLEIENSAIVVARSHPNLYSLVYPSTALPTIPPPVIMHVPPALGTVENHKKKEQAHSLKTPLLAQDITVAGSRKKYGE